MDVHLSGTQHSTWAQGYSWRSQFWSQLGRSCWVCPCYDAWRQYLWQYLLAPFHILLMRNHSDFSMSLLKNCWHVMFTWGLSQVECFTLLEGCHLIAGLVFPGMFKAVEVDTLAVDDDIWQLFSKFDLRFLQRHRMATQVCSALSTSNASNMISDSNFFFCIPLILVFVHSPYWHLQPHPPQIQRHPLWFGYGWGQHLVCLVVFPWQGFCPSAPALRQNLFLLHVLLYNC